MILCSADYYIYYTLILNSLAVYMQFYINTKWACTKTRTESPLAMVPHAAGVTEFFTVDSVFIKFTIFFWHKTIRIFNGCEVRIENSVTRVTVRHHDACLTLFDAEQLSRVTKFSICTSQPLQIHFLAYFSFDNCIYAGCYLINFTITTFLSKKCSFQLLSKKLTSKCLAQNDVKMSELTSCMKSSYISSYKAEISRTGENRRKPCRVCKKRLFQARESLSQEKSQINSPKQRIKRNKCCLLFWALIISCMLFDNIKMNKVNWHIQINCLLIWENLSPCLEVL